MKVVLFVGPTAVFSTRSMEGNNHVPDNEILISGPYFVFFHFFFCRDVAW